MGKNQTISFGTYRVSNMNSGIVLVFSYHDGTEVKDWSLQSYFVPKELVPTNDTDSVQMCFKLSDRSFGVVGTKYLYIYNSKITGHDDNTKNGTATNGSGIKFNNNNFVLRKVYGV